MTALSLAESYVTEIYETISLESNTTGVPKLILGVHPFYQPTFHH